MTAKPLKSQLRLGSWLGLAGFAAMIGSLMLSIGAPKIGSVFVWIASFVALAGAWILMSAGLTWYRWQRARERRGEADD
ncbi:MAG: hypothetical protein QM698_15790 [Micropepsaceae bacterium]